MLNKDYVQLYRQEFVKNIRLTNRLLLTLKSEAIKPGFLAMLTVCRALMKEKLPREQMERKWDDIYQRINNPSITRELFRRVYENEIPASAGEELAPEEVVQATSDLQPSVSGERPSLSEVSNP